ncbi:MAG: hypothetical protein J6Z11_11690 [Candidatus Riflebacteria bacterium]|nr:hypothetical protein [Candidatus Riflebacteria bacterium]
MECLQCIFVAVFVIIAIISNVSKIKDSLPSSSGDTNPSMDLDEIFRKVSGESGGSSQSSLPDYQPPATAGRRRRRPALNTPKVTPNPSRESMTTPSSHNSHNCEEVNFDNLGSLEGGTGSFNLGEPAQVLPQQEKPKVTIGREDLLKSFIMSEVLQRYDINRIYSRIPSIKKDE